MIHKVPEPVFIIIQKVIHHNFNMEMDKAISLSKLLILLLCVNFSFGVSYTKERFPDPLKDPAHCGGSQSRRSFLCDPDKLFTSDQRTEIDSIIKQVENSTKCICPKCLPNQHGFRVGVAVVKNVPVISGKSLSTSMIIFGDYVRQKWDIGKCGDDILVLLSLGDKKIYASRGGRVTKILNGDVLRDIYEEQGDKLYSYEGLRNVLLSFKDSFHDSQDLNKKMLPYIIGGVVGGVVILIIILACVITSCRRKRNKPKKVAYGKRQKSVEMQRKIDAFESSGRYPGNNSKDYKKVSLDEPDYASNV